jgi:hypothetical protein
MQDRLHLQGDHNRPSLGPNLTQTDPMQILILHFNIHFNIILGPNLH